MSYAYVLITTNMNKLKQNRKFSFMFCYLSVYRLLNNKWFLVGDAVFFFISLYLRLNQSKYYMLKRYAIVFYDFSESPNVYDRLEIIIF